MSLSISMSKGVVVVHTPRAVVDRPRSQPPRAAQLRQELGQQPGGRAGAGTIVADGDPQADVRAAVWAREQPSVAGQGAAGARLPEDDQRVLHDGVQVASTAIAQRTSRDRTRPPAAATRLSAVGAHHDLRANLAARGQPRGALAQGDHAGGARLCPRGQRRLAQLRVERCPRSGEDVSGVVATGGPGQPQAPAAGRDKDHFPHPPRAARRQAEVVEQPHAARARSGRRTPCRAGRATGRRAGPVRRRGPARAPPPLQPAQSRQREHRRRRPSPGA
jgi:hypothetical protein